MPEMIEGRVARESCAVVTGVVPPLTVRATDQEIVGGPILTIPMPR
jgi:hypothetical protein